MQRSGLGLLGFGALFAAALAASAVGCRDDSNSSGSDGPSGPGGTGAGSTTSSGDGGSGSGTGGTMNTGGGGQGGSGGGGMELPVVTIQEITSGAIPSGVDVEVHGVVAMSPKYMVSQSNSGSCLYGVYISAPGLTETEPNSGVLAISYGSMATTGSDGNLYCARLGEDPAGDAFPDDVKPGDVLDIVGETSHFLLSFCGDACGDTTCTADELACYNNSACMEHRCWEDCSADPLPYAESQVKQRQLAKVSKVERTGTGPVPVPHALSADEMLKLSSGTDQAFRDTWGGVKVRLTNVTPVPWSTGKVVNFGSIVADTDPSVMGVSKVQIGNDIYYRGYAPMDQFCHKSPVFDTATITWNHVDGFVTLDTCTWTLQAVDMCADFDPASSSCMGATSCPQ